MQFDELVFHYTKIDTAITYILQNRQLKFSTIKNTNDPYEKYPYVFTHSPKNASTDSGDALAMKKCMWLSEHLKKEIQILCLTKDMLSDNLPGMLIYNLGRGYTKPRMWAQYADDFKGICLGIKKHNLISKIEDVYQDKELEYGDVIYSTEEGYVTKVIQATSLKEDSNILSNEEILEKMLRKYKETYFFTKHPDWKTENEFRVIIRDKNENNNYIDIDGALEFIVVGTEVEDDKVEVVLQKVEQFKYKPKVYRIDFWDGYYHIEPINNRMGE